MEVSAASASNQINQIKINQSIKSIPAKGIYAQRKNFIPLPKQIVFAALTRHRFMRMFAYTVSSRAVLPFLAWLLVSQRPRLSWATKVTPSASLPHDEKCFTQGLEIYQGKLYESCGLYGQSSVRIVDPSSGRVVRKQRLKKEYFAEGIAIKNNVLYMLTWINRVMFILDLQNFKVQATKRYSSYNGEGWGLATYGDSFIMSDGSERLSYFEIPSDSLNKTKSSVNEELIKIKDITVRDPLTERPIQGINELELVNGYLYANVWYQDIILKIDPSDGKVIHKYDLAMMYPKWTRKPGVDCLNGIAYNSSDDTFLFTGKLWPRYYKARLDTGEDTAAVGGSSSSTNIITYIDSSAPGSSIKRVNDSFTTPSEKSKDAQELSHDEM